MGQEVRSWWKGSFPSWMVMGLLSITGTFSWSMLQEQKKINTQVILNQMDMVEQKMILKNQGELISELKRANDKMADNFDALRREIRRL